MAFASEGTFGLKCESGRLEDLLPRDTQLADSLAESNPLLPQEKSSLYSYPADYLTI